MSLIRLGLIAAVAAGALSAQVDLSGKWNVSATPEGRKEIRLDAEFKQENGELTGQVNSPMGTGPVRNSRLGNPHVAFQFLIGKNVFDVAAEIEGEDTLKGTFTGPRNMKGVFLARRAESTPVAAPAEGVTIGELNGSGYRIDIPANFNGTLVLYCHGYGGATKFDNKPPNPMMKAFLEAGYALAQAGYSAAGWAVKEALDDTEALRRLFVSKFGRPKRTYVMGHSMGGVITLGAIEKFPEAYDGALPICGPTGPSITELQKRVFDSLVVFDYYFPGLIGSPANPGDAVRPDPSFAAELAKAMEAEPDKRAALTRYMQLAAEKETPMVVAFFANIQKELAARAGGNAFDNRNTQYWGTADDVALNRGVKRYASDAAAAEYLRKYVMLTGRPAKPVLSLHTTYDPLVPAWAANSYGEMAARNGSENYVQRFVARNGHCAVTPAETLRAFEDLVAWREQGKRPESGEQK